MQHAGQPEVAARPAWMSEIKLRLASGLVLAVLALGTNYAGHLTFALMVTALALVMSWEWGRLVRRQESDHAFIIQATAVVSAIVLTVMGLTAFAWLLVIGGAIAVVPLRLGRGAHISALGVLYVGLPAVALVWIRCDEPYGAVAIMLLFLAVWTTDTGAYVAGRLIGGPKLCPSISPNKTWAGLAGGVSTAALACGLLGLTVEGAAPGPLAALGALLAVFAQGGDLAESALKRRYGVKDVSQLIPGHGGFMDRLDGLVAASAIAGVVALVLNVSAPARALVFFG